MAFEMVNNQVLIDSIMDSDVCAGVIVDLSKNIDKTIVMFDLLYMGLGFPGYHYDVEPADNASTELCFVFQ